MMDPAVLLMQGNRIPPSSVICVRTGTDRSIIVLVPSLGKILVSHWQTIAAIF